MKIFGEVKIPVAAASTGGALQGFVWDRSVRGEKVAFGSDVVTIQGTNANEQPLFADLVAIVVAGGSFTGIRLALKFDNVAAAQQAVPAEIRGATHIVKGEFEEEGVEQSRNWIEWLQVNSSTQIYTDGAEYVINTDTSFQSISHEFTYSVTTRYFGCKEDNISENGGVYFDNLSIKKR